LGFVFFLSLLGGANGAEFFLWNRFQTGSEDFRIRLTLLAPCLEVVVSRGQPVPEVIKLFIYVIYECFVISKSVGPLKDFPAYFMFAVKALDYLSKMFQVLHYMVGSLPYLQTLY
jgi:hypothetical protein